MSLEKKLREDITITQNRLLRLLELMMLLTSGKYSLSYLAERLGVTERTIYRYMILLQTVGFKIAQQGKKDYARFSIESWPQELLKTRMEVAAA